jgi:hypothetical protein
MAFLHGVFTVFKFLFGLGALAGLIAIGLMLLWFVGHAIARSILAGQPSDRLPGVRQLFLEP